MRLPHLAAPPFAAWARFCAAYAALNAPYWLVGHWLYIGRPVFNIELAVPLLVAVWSVPAALVLLTLFWALDLAVSQAHSYHFASPLEFLRSAQFIDDVHVAHWVSAEHLAIGLLFIVPAALAMKWTPRRHAPWIPALTLVVTLTALDAANGSSMVLQRGARVIQANISNSPTTTLLVRAWNERQQQPLSPMPGGSSATAIANVAGWSSAHPNGSVLIVIVESMGWHVDARLREWLREQLFERQLEPYYRLREDAVPFRGSTTAAELRELCGLYGSYRSLDAKVGATCLPARLARQGWSTVGMHGFSSHMFDRADWWPLVGLETRRFAQDLASLDGERCGGAFAGICDATLIGAALTEARSPRRLVYALTLNSHLPLAPTEIPIDLQQRCQLAGDDVCQLTATIGIALRALRDGLARPGPSPQVVVVGDHAPPFGSLQNRNQYDATRVPVFILTPA